MLSVTSLCFTRIGNYLACAKFAIKQQQKIKSEVGGIDNVQEIGGINKEKIFANCYHGLLFTAESGIP